VSITLSPSSIRTASLIAGALGALALAPATAVARSAAPVAHDARAGNKIVLFESIDGVRLGITPAQARRELGTPSHTIRVGGKISEYDFSEGGVSFINVTFDTLNRRDLANGVFGFATTMRTPQGIHPGSTVAQLKRAYGRALHHFPGGYAMYRGTPGAIGSPTTQFGVLNGKVELIDVQTTFNDL
jgi:hypothetical protein